MVLAFSRPQSGPGKTIVVSSADGVQNEIFVSAKDQFGHHANEKQMPRWLVRVLKSGDKVVTKDALDSKGEKIQVEVKIVETPGLIPVLAQLSRTNPSIAWATFCSPYVHHVSKLRREGSFCGYRNIQMMISYINNTKAPGYSQSEWSPLPSIFSLQDMIEDAWDHGFNTASRDDIGHIRMTRKFIGTSEVEALFLSMKIPVSTQSFVSTSEATAYQSLVEYVSNYFGCTNSSSETDRVVVTSKPPIFLQRPGHSMTIVGIDRDMQGTTALIVFDPKYSPTKGMKQLASGGPLPAKTTRLRERHRYSSSELGMYDAFEVVQLDNCVAIRS